MRRRRSAGGASGLVAAGFFGGLAVGALWWAGEIRRSQRNLFSTRPLRRLAALGYLGGHPSVETARLLRDYIRWEPRPALRRRGEHLLRRMESYLD